MYTNLNELMLHSRQGRLPPGIRASSRRVAPVARHQRKLRSRRLVSPVVSVVGARAEARSRTRQARARERYLELEFAVGFTAEDELGRPRR